MASADVIDIVVTGKGGHASTPYLANDPMPVAAEIVQALQVMVTRRINAFDPVVITITKMTRRHHQQRDPRVGAPARHVARGFRVGPAARDRRNRAGRDVDRARARDAAPK